MITKGTTHNNGVRLANYMTTGKPGERAELWQLRGFEATNIRDAFRDVQIMAKATKCQQPFLHVQVRNRDGEELSRHQWEYAADRIEKMLGLSGQPRAIAFHTFDDGNSHMHVAWSRIQEDTLKAIPVPFFKSRLKKLSRELELEFALEPVADRRVDGIRFAPTRAEQEQARRLGVDIHEIRTTIRTCYEQSDSGSSFRTALEAEGLILARGERRDFLVVDEAGGIHALGKRMLDVTAARIRERLSDLPRGLLPTVEMAREAMLGGKLAEIQNAIEAEQQIAPVRWDRDQANQRWQDAVINSAIEKEKVDKRFVESVQSTPPLEQIGTAAHIRDARQHSDNAQAFVTALAERGISLAQATRADAVESQLENAEAKLTGRWKPTFREGEIVAVTNEGKVWKLTAHTIGDKDEREIQKFLGEFDKPLPSIQEARHRREREQDLEELKPRGRFAFGPRSQGMVEQQTWAMDRIKAAEEFRRKEEGRRADEAMRKSAGEVDPHRYLADPEYRRQVKAERAHQTPAERKSNRENEARVMQEQQDRQR